MCNSLGIIIYDSLFQQVCVVTLKFMFRRLIATELVKIGLGPCFWRIAVLKNLSLWFNSVHLSQFVSSVFCLLLWQISKTRSLCSISKSTSALSIFLTFSSPNFFVDFMLWTCNSLSSAGNGHLFSQASPLASFLFWRSCFLSFFLLLLSK